MSKNREPNDAPFNEGLDQDWFLPAILSNGSVSHSFREVSTRLENKLTLIQCLNTNLSSYQGKSTDSISELRKRIGELSNTMTFRLGMLSPERPGAWFRENMNQGSGPFGSRVLSEPILAPYDVAKIANIRFQLKNSFQQRNILDIPFERKEPCLWLTLLNLNRCWEEIDRLPSPHRELRLSELPSSIPSELKSPSLHAFLTKVNESQLSARQELDSCFAKLWNACEAFWQVQIKIAEKENSQKKERRRCKQDISSFRNSDIRALQFMNFSSLPDARTLKSRYHNLAQRYHPDRPGGCEDSFKRLTLSYSQLMKRIQSLDSSPVKT